MSVVRLASRPLPACHFKFRFSDSGQEHQAGLLGWVRTKYRTFTHRVGTAGVLTQTVWLKACHCHSLRRWYQCDGLCVMAGPAGASGGDGRQCRCRACTYSHVRLSEPKMAAWGSGSLQHSLPGAGTRLGFKSPGLEWLPGSKPELQHWHLTDFHQSKSLGFNERLCFLIKF